MSIGTYGEPDGVSNAVDLPCSYPFISRRHSLFTSTGNSLSRPNRQFKILDITKSNLPHVDLILCRDCLGPLTGLHPRLPVIAPLMELDQLIDGEAPAPPLRIEVANADKIGADRVLTVKRDSAGKLSGAVIESAP
jgi:hypothetical protein